jgi:phosphoribosylamine---glycine ligase
MKVLVVGSGGREHVLCWKLAQSPKVEKVYCAPGNAGIAQDAECVNIGVDKLNEMADFAVSNGIEFCVVGPEAPLCDGMVDVMRAKGLKVFGPDKEAAQLEGSKDYAKQFMLKYNIPTAESELFTSVEPAADYINAQFNKGKKGIVVKADGLAAGKGVLVAFSADEAIEFVKECFEGAFGCAGAKVLVEECLFGEEASILALTDGKTILPLVSSQDHKRAFEGDAGPNTGGMGSYSPAPIVTEAMMAQIKAEVLDPFLNGIQTENLDFRGLVFVGIMVTEDGPKVLEFNVRFGDPEVQSVMMRLDSDLFEAMDAVVDRRLSEVTLDWSDDTAVCVVLASGGYPVSYTKGFPILGLDEAAATGAVVFHAGTTEKDGKIVNSGGRVLGVTARGNDIRAALNKAYAAVDKICWEGCFCRRDIAYRALERLQS